MTKSGAGQAALRMIGGRPAYGWLASVSAKSRRVVLPPVPRTELRAALAALMRAGPESDLACRLIAPPPLADSGRSKVRIVETPSGRRLDLRVSAPRIDLARDAGGRFLRDELRSRLRAGEADFGFVQAGPQRLLLHRDVVEDPEAGVLLDLALAATLPEDGAAEVLELTLWLFGVEAWRTPLMKTWLDRSERLRRRSLREQPSALPCALSEAIKRRGAGSALDAWLNSESTATELSEPLEPSEPPEHSEAASARTPALTPILSLDRTFGERLGLRELLVARRRLGAFDTPPELAAALIERSLGPTIAGARAARDLLDLSLLDPTCGAGRMLVAAVDRIAERLRELPDAEAAGVDLSDHAAALKSSRALVIRRPEGLRGLDLDPIAVDFTRAALRALASGPLPADAVLVGDVFSEAAPSSRSKQRHLIGNPPWRSFYSRESARPLGEALTEAAEAWRRRPGLEQRLGGRVNLYLLFLSRALELNPRGPVTLILPDSLAVNGSLAATRAWLATRFDGCHRIENPGFRANVGVCLTRFRGTDEPAGEVPLVTLGRARELFAQGASVGPGRATTLTAEDLKRDPQRRWIPDSPATVIELGAEAAVPLGELAEIRDGINPGPAEWRRRLLLELGTEAEPDDDPESDPDPSLRPCLEGRQITPFAIAPARLLVRADPSRISPEARRRGTSLRRPEIFDRPGILTRQTAPRIIAAVEEEGRRFLNSAHKILPHDEAPELRHRLCAFLNSDWLSETYRHMSGETRRVFPQVHIAMLRRLPVPRELATIPTESVSAGPSERARRLSELGERASRAARVEREAIQTEIERLVRTVVRASRPR